MQQRRRKSERDAKEKMVTESSSNIPSNKEKDCEKKNVGRKLFHSQQSEDKVEK